jgi:hypothetical protein
MRRAIALVHSAPVLLPARRQQNTLFLIFFLKRAAAFTAANASSHAIGAFSASAAACTQHESVTHAKRPTNACNALKHVNALTRPKPQISGLASATAATELQQSSVSSDKRFSECNGCNRAATEHALTKPKPHTGLRPRAAKRHTCSELRSY